VRNFFENLNSFKGVGKFCAGNSLLHADGTNVKLLKISIVRPLNPGKYEVLLETED
jgi:hypothetical protein